MCHANDIVVYGRGQTENEARLHQVLTRLSKEGLALNKEKCEFGKNKLMFLGHSLSTEGVKPNLNKVKAMLDTPEPTCAADVRQVMGMANYLGNFIPDFSSVREDRMVLGDTTAGSFSEAEIRTELTQSPGRILSICKDTCFG